MLREDVWNGNRETLRGAVGGRDALIPYALRMHRSRRRRYPAELASFPVVRLRTPADVDGVRHCRRRALNSATQAAARRPIQIGVRIT